MLRRKLNKFVDRMLFLCQSNKMHVYIILLLVFSVACATSCTNLKIMYFLFLYRLCHAICIPTQIWGNNKIRTFSIRFSRFLPNTNWLFILSLSIPQILKGGFWSRDGHSWIFLLAFSLELFFLKKINQKNSTCYRRLNFKIDYIAFIP